MALPEEQAIMNAVGLGQHYTWFNGGGCHEVRNRAVKRLPDALRAAGYVPDVALIGLVPLVATAEKSPYELTETWCCIADVIRAHIEEQAMGPDAFGDRIVELFDRYEPQPELFMANGTMARYA